MRPRSYARDAIEEARKRREWFEAMQKKLRTEADALEPVIAALLAEEQELVRLDDEAGELVTKELLHSRERFGSVSDVTRKHHGLAISKAAAGTDPFRLHITKRGLSQNKVAKKAGCSTAALSRYRSGRPVPTTIANRIQAATEWPADAEHWPGGLV